MKGKIMSKLVYTTALSLLTSCAMAMDPTADEMRLIQANSELIISDDERCITPSSLADETMPANLGSAEYLDTPKSSEYGTRSKIINLPKKFSGNLSRRVAAVAKLTAKESFLGHEREVTGVLSSVDASLNRLDCKKEKKSKAKSRKSDRYLKQIINEGIRNYFSSDNEEQLSVSTCEDDSATCDSSHLAVQDETIISLFDFALWNQIGRSSTYEWSAESNEAHMQQCFEMLWDIHDRCSGELPGVAQILLGDLLPIATYEQENVIIGLLDNKKPSFTAEDVAVLLAGIDNYSPLDVLSIQNIEDNCVIGDPITLYAALLKPFMKYRVFEHSQDEENDLEKIIEYIEKAYESLGKEERQEITAKLNIMAIFESGLAAEYAETTGYKGLIQQLSAKIASGEISNEDAADNLYRQLKDDKALEYEVATYVGMLNEERFQSYTWKDNEDGSEIDSQGVIKDSEDEIASQDSRNTKSGQETDYSDAAEVEL